MTASAPPRDLAAAVEAGIITPEQGMALRNFLTPEADLIPNDAAAAGSTASDAADNERFRVLGGFSDIFVALGLALLYGAVLLAANAFDALLLSLISVALAWGLSEVFSRRMRLALPSILLANAFAYSMLITVFLAFGYLTDGYSTLRNASFTRWMGVPGILAGTAMAGAAWLHFRRFGVPINWAIGVAGGVIAMFALIVQLTGLHILAHANTIIGTLGFTVFGIALWMDARDPLRQTTRADSAFWLHLLAAPMIVHPLVGGYAWGGFGLRSASSASTGVMLTIVALFVIMAIVSIIIDRRALLVSGLSYTGVAIAGLVRSFGLNTGQTGLIVTLLVLALIVLSLSAFWQTLRRAVVPRLPLGLWRAYLPPA
jgi:hypothetical protein